MLPDHQLSYATDHTPAQHLELTGVTEATPTTEELQEVTVGTGFLCFAESHFRLS
jgi:hypothetical protein